MNQNKRSIIIFYSSLSDFINLNIRFSQKTSSLVFIEIKEYREQKSNFIRFMENELNSIPLFNRLSSLLKLILKVLSPFYRKKNNNQYIDFKKSYEGRYSSLFEHVTPEINEKCDLFSREVFDQLKEYSFFKRSFNINEINLFEANRFDFVHNLYYILLNLFTLRKIIAENSPVKIYVTPSVSLLNKSILQHLSGKHNLPCVELSAKKSSLWEKTRKFLERFKFIAERIWFWQIWKILYHANGSFEINKITNTKILTLLHYKNFYPSMNEVLKKVNTSDKYSVFLFTPHKLLQYIKRQINFNHFDNTFLIPVIDYNYSLFRKNFIRLKHQLLSFLELKDLDFIKADSIVLSKFLKIALFDTIEKYASTLRYHVSIKKVIEKLKPQLIVVLSGNDPFDVLATRVAKLYKIPTLFIPHALISRRRDFIALEQDFIICAGNRDKDYYVSLGTPPNKVHVLGIPLYDKAYQEIERTKKYIDLKKKINDKYGLDPNKKIILLVTTFHEDYMRKKIFNSVIQTLEELKDYQLIVKLHPIETDSFYKQLISENKFDPIPLIQESVLHELIIASDLVIGSISGAQIEALLLDRNVINLIYEKASDPLLMDEYNAAITVFNPNELKIAITSTMNNIEIQEKLKVGRKRYVDYCLYKFDGKASNRVFKLIKEILDK